MRIYVTTVYRLYSAAYRFLDEFSRAVVIKFHQRVPQKRTFRADTLSQQIQILPLQVFLSEVDPHNLCMMTNLAWQFDWSVDPTVMTDAGHSYRDFFGEIIRSGT